MTVSDEESIVGTDSRIASTGAAELKVNIFIYKYLDLYNIGYILFLVARNNPRRIAFSR